MPRLPAEQIHGSSVYQEVRSGSAAAAAQPLWGDPGKQKNTQDVCRTSLVMLSQQEAGLGHCRLRGFMCVWEEPAEISREWQGSAYTDTQHSCPSTGLGSRDWYPLDVILDRGFQPPRRTLNEMRKETAIEKSLQAKKKDVYIKCSFSFFLTSFLPRSQNPSNL